MCAIKWRRSAAGGLREWSAWDRGKQGKEILTDNMCSISPLSFRSQVCIAVAAAIAIANTSSWHWREWRDHAKTTSRRQDLKRRASALGLGPLRPPLKSISYKRSSFMRTIWTNLFQNGHLGFISAQCTPRVCFLVFIYVRVLSYVFPLYFPFS